MTPAGGSVDNGYETLSSLLKPPLMGEPAPPGPLFPPGRRPTPGGGGEALLTEGGSSISLTQFAAGGSVIRKFPKMGQSCLLGGHARCGRGGRGGGRGVRGGIEGVREEEVDTPPVRCLTRVCRGTVDIPGRDKLKSNEKWIRIRSSNRK